MESGRGPGWQKLVKSFFLTEQLQGMGSAALYRPHAAPTRVLFAALLSNGLGHTAFIGFIVICLFLVPKTGKWLALCCILGLDAMACPLLLVVLLALIMLIGLTECGWLAIVMLRSTWSLNVLPMLLCGLGMHVCSRTALTT